ncbi:LysR family transcriptional regulator [Variovorax saccharolyticus]|uniref:LysR family transcriptional regulator n=1 Tax=Variovorax saccharolyticus TaxID=3053516 RepID=UPI0025762685|nr:LysR family transcriptional regulator [Variovorax sp. J31P216]MDM0027706.1 LysR family transcriptional regulator [Variovorax sp. J31P216]
MSNRLEALRVFCTAADAVNFRDAAVRLSVSPQVVTRAVRDLEEELGEPLFHRNTRGVQLTDFGRGLADRARAAVDGVDGLFHRSDRRALSQHAGTVRVAAPGVLGRRLIPQALAPMLVAHPGLTLDLRLSEQLADVVDQQIDVGVRIGPLRDSRFVARPVAKVPFRVVAAPSLIARTGAPDSIEALSALPRTALIDRNSGRPWPWLFSRGRQLPMPPAAFITDDTDAEFAAVLAGLGFGQLVASMAQAALDAGQLVSVLDAEAPEPWPMYVYRAQRAPVPARVRLVYDELVRALG